MARKARSSSRSRRSRSKSRRSRSRSRSHSGQYLSKASARSAFNRAYKGRPAAAKKDRSSTRNVTRTRKYLKDPKKYDYPGVDTRARKMSKSKSRSLSKKRRSVSKKRRSLSKSKKNCWSDFTLKELQLITEDIGGKMYKDRTRLCRQLNKYYKIEESIDASLSKEKEKMAIQKQMLAAKAAQKAREAAEKVAQRAADKAAKLAARAASISASLSTPGSGSFSGNKKAIEDFIRGYASKSYKGGRPARIREMRRDLADNQKKSMQGRIDPNDAAAYAKWQKAPWEYDIEGVDTEGSAENFLDSLTQAYRTENAGKLKDDDRSLWNLFTGGTSAAAPDDVEGYPMATGSSVPFGGSPASPASGQLIDFGGAPTSSTSGLFGSGRNTAQFGGSVQRRRNRRASRQGRRMSRRASRSRSRK